MRPAAAGTWLSLIAMLAVAGCGGDDSSSAADASPSAAQDCLEDAGLDVRPGEPTSGDMSAVLFINLDQLDQVYVAFMDSAEAAERVQEGLGGLAQQAGGNAGAEVVGDAIVLARARDTTSAQVDQVTGCLTTS